MVIPIACTASNLKAFSDNILPGNSSRAISLLVNGTASGLNCTITAGNSTCSSSQSVSLVAGDGVSFSVVPSSSPTAARMGVSWTCQ
jgi:hypothetical protein